MMNNKTASNISHVWERIFLGYRGNPSASSTR
jgi:hypothetical protein